MGATSVMGVMTARGLNRTARTTAAALALALGSATASGCIVGSRGVVEIAAEYSVQNVNAVRIDLPDTPLSVRGDPTAAHLNLRARWFSVGGTIDVAEKNATAPSFDYQIDGGFALLQAVVPVDVREVVDLEVDSITLPVDRDIELHTGLGDVVVTHMEGNVSVDIDAGTVFIVGGAGGVGARTGVGDVEIHSPGNVDVSTGVGDVLVEQSGPGGNSVHVLANEGDVEVTLSSDANLHVKVDALGDIRIQTGTISTVTSGSFEREVGNGTVEVWITAPLGNVRVLHVHDDSIP